MDCGFQVQDSGFFFSETWIPDTVAQIIVTMMITMMVLIMIMIMTMMMVMMMRVAQHQSMKYQQAHSNIRLSGAGTPSSRPGAVQ